MAKEDDYTQNQSLSLEIQTLRCNSLDAIFFSLIALNSMRVSTHAKFERLSRKNRARIILFVLDLLDLTLGSEFLLFERISHGSGRGPVRAIFLPTYFQ